MRKRKRRKIHIAYIVLTFQGREESVKANVFTGNLKLNWYFHRSGREGWVKDKPKSLPENGYSGTKH